MPRLECRHRLIWVRHLDVPPFAVLDSTQPSSPPRAPVTFTSPPVNEVVLAVQFAGDVIDEVGILNRYLPTIQRAFPKLEKQPPLPPMQEDLAHPPGPGGPQVQFFQGPPATRYWFISADDTLLIQVQSDRFILNWRQTEAKADYPRYEKLRPAFEHHFSNFLTHVSSADEPPALNFCEVTYINHIEAAGAVPPGTHGPLSHVLRALDPEPVSAALPPIEDTQLQQRFLINDESGESYGRLYISAVPAFRAEDSTPIYVVSLVARGRPTPQTPDGAVPFFDMGRDLIVRGFKESTTPQLHKQWGLQDDE
jgi:uncharacterized protein (TIGR04255 family)